MSVDRQVAPSHEASTRRAPGKIICQLVNGPTTVDDVPAPVCRIMITEPWGGAGAPSPATNILHYSFFTPLDFVCQAWVGKTFQLPSTSPARVAEGRNHLLTVK